MRGTRLVLVGLIPLIVGLSCMRPPGSPEVCPLDANERQLVAEIIAELLRDALFVTDNTNDLEQASSLSLAGVEQSYATVAFLVGECQGSEEFEPFCEAGGLPPGEGEEPFWQTRDRCGQLGCEAANVRLTTVYFTMRPRTNPDDRHAFTYETTIPAGSAVYDSNPLISWRVDRTAEDRNIFSSNFEFQLEITPTGGEAINLSHEGSFEAIQENDEITELAFSIYFPELGRSGGLIVALALTIPDEITGTIDSGGSTLASISMQRGGEPEVEWVAACRQEKPVCRIGETSNSHCKQLGHAAIRE